MKDEKTSEAGSAEDVETPAVAPKRSHKKRWIAGAVVAVAVVAGFGFNAWHETPGFCNAICHDPMDAYVETYTQGTSDKYGNDLTEEQSLGMMSRLHEVTLNEDGSSAATCLDCHVPSLGEQVTEGIHWATGNVETAGENAKGQDILESRTFAQLTEARGSNSEALCLKSGCHTNPDGSDMQRSDLIAATTDLSDTRNPHLAQHGEIDCGTCHKSHSQSVNYCSQCHTDAPIPEGWLSYAEADEMGVL
jgi:hypothetical protein